MRARLYDLRLGNNVRIRYGFLRFAWLAHIGEVVLNDRQRFGEIHFAIVGKSDTSKYAGFLTEPLQNVLCPLVNR